MLLFVRQTEKLREMVNKLCVYVVPNLLLMLSNIADTVNKHKTTIADFYNEMDQPPLPSHSIIDPAIVTFLALLNGTFLG